MIVVDYQGRGWSAEEIARQYAYLTLPEAADQSHPEATRQLVARTRRLRDLLAGFGRRHRGLSLVEPPADGVGVRKGKGGNRRVGLEFQG